MATKKTEKKKGRVIGKLGSVVFEISNTKILTFDNLERSGSASIQTHSGHNKRSLAEFTGVEAQKLSLDIVLSEYFGVKPVKTQKELIEYCNKGTALELTINNGKIGTNRWLISDWKSKYETFGNTGAVRTITMSITLVEYLKQSKTTKKKSATTKKTTITKSSSKKTTTTTAKKGSTSSSTKKVGDVVSFKGGYHYVSSDASSHSGKCAAGPAKIYAIAKGAKHPYCLIHTNSKSTVYGWVDASTFS